MTTKKDIYGFDQITHYYTPPFRKVDINMLGSGSNGYRVEANIPLGVKLTFISTPTGLMVYEEEVTHG